MGISIDFSLRHTPNELLHKVGVITYRVVLNIKGNLIFCYIFFLLFFTFLLPLLYLLVGASIITLDITELYKINTQLNSYSKKLSNIDEIANSISTTSCKLVSLWNNGNYQDKVKLQKLVFPEGVLWDKVNESFRTLKINRVFDVIHSLTDNYNDKKERSDNEIAPLSHLVEKRRLERPTPTSRTWCATNCATSRCFSNRSKK